jgi:hypothetical protein
MTMAKDIVATTPSTVDSDKVGLPCACTGCTNSRRNTSTTVCPLFNFCCKCNDISRRNGKILMKLPSRANCLFDCCSYDSRFSLDQRAFQLQKIMHSISAIAFTDQTNNTTLKSDLVLVHQIPAGTFVLCSWHLNSVSV